jgi:putative redox protein
MRTISLRWVEGQLMVGTDSNDHSIVIGKSREPEAKFLGVKPADLLLMAAAACSTWDVVEILIKQREPVRDIYVSCSGEQLSDPPWTFTNLHLHFQIVGKVRSDRVEKAIKLSEEKYCSVVNTLKLAIPVEYDFEIIPE